MITAKEARAMVNGKTSAVLEQISLLIREEAIKGKTSLYLPNSGFDAQAIAEGLQRNGYQVTIPGNSKICETSNIRIHW